MNIQLVDLTAQYEIIKPEIDEAIQRVIGKAAFIGGGEVQAFRKEFAAWCAEGNPAGSSELHCATCANGTDAIYLTLRALGVTGGDEVITVANTFIATSEAISMTGARPVFV